MPAAREPLLRRLRDEGTSPALRGIPFVGRLAAWVSAFADDVIIFGSNVVNNDQRSLLTTMSSWL